MIFAVIFIQKILLLGYWREFSYWIILILFNIRCKIIIQLLGLGYNNEIRVQVIKVCD